MRQAPTTAVYNRNERSRVSLRAGHEPVNVEEKHGGESYCRTAFGEWYCLRHNSPECSRNRGAGVSVFFIVLLGFSSNVEYPISKVVPSIIRRGSDP